MNISCPNEWETGCQSTVLAKHHFLAVLSWFTKEVFVNLPFYNLSLVLISQEVEVERQLQA
jgi:hypothetical protein